MSSPAGAISGSTENLSSEGLFIRTERLLTPGDPVQLHLSFPGLLAPVDIEATVRWTRPERGDEPAGVGVLLSPESRLKVAALVRAARPEVRSTRPFRILVVEDNPHVVQMYRFALKKLGGAVAIDVEVAPDGHEALRVLAMRPADLVVADLRMPVLDGLEMLKRVRKDAKLMSTPVIVISGADREIRVAAEEAGADAVLRKPVRSSDVLETVRGLLALRG